MWNRTKNHKYTKLKGKIIINATSIWFEGTGKTIPLNSILKVSIILDFKMRNRIIWHWFIKNLVGTWPRNDVDATSLRRIDVITTSCACWEFGSPLPPPQNSKPWPPQYSKPSYAYEYGVSLAKDWVSVECGTSAFMSHVIHWIKCCWAKWNRRKQIIEDQYDMGT